MRVTGDGLEVSPVDVVTLEATHRTGRRPLPDHARDWLREAEDYCRGDLMTNAPAEMVVALMREILRQRDEIQLLKVGYATRSQLAKQLTGVRMAAGASGGRQS
jgi:hypothetical protein